MARRILIVEPDRQVAEEMWNLLYFEHGRFERESYELGIAQCVAEAFEQVQAVDYHCIIMDVNLPEMDGYEAVELLKTVSRNTPIILTAEHNTRELESKVREKDVYYYYLRSFGQDELRLAVGSLFNGQARREGAKRSEEGASRPVRLKQLCSSPKKEDDDMVIGAAVELERKQL
jgi:DNA-binding NarL/FixJ family response regulator